MRTKKIIVAGMLILLSSAVFAEDDLDALINSLDDNNTSASSSTQQEEKIKVQIIDKTPNSVTLKFDPISNYKNYKIYYSKNGDNSFKEKEVTANGNNPIQVTVDNLQPGTTYKFIVKAFDENGNPIESTSSDPVTATTPTEKSTQNTHSAANDNVIYNPRIISENGRILIKWTPGKDVDKVQISISEDGRSFKPVATVDGQKGSYTYVPKTSGKKYVKLVPIAKDGSLGVCKTGTAEVNAIPVKVNKPVTPPPGNPGKPKTGVELYLLFVIAIVVSGIYVYRKR